MWRNHRGGPDIRHHCRLALDLAAGFIWFDPA